MQIDMRDKSQAVGDFINNISLESLFLFIIIAILIMLFCFITIKLKRKNNLIYKARLVIIFLIAMFFLKFVFLIPAFVDVYTDSIEFVEISNYEFLYHNQSQFSLNPYGTTVIFTTTDEESLYGYLLSEYVFSNEPCVSFLYAKHSHYIIDCFFTND